ncbi:MAG: insulinase family protein [Bdellovibrionaceae bacterium]|nr:insulinase family protein [Bdellovibrionales bacterium]MCB9083388.1 insulinase family protein [Pseudobdellovibrionaceae bacterium]
MKNYSNWDMLIRMTMSLVVGLCSSLSLAQDEMPQQPDPYSQIEFMTLENGLEIILAPGSAARTVKIYYEVDVGYGVESKRNLGVAHLLEHSLFRHPDLSENMSFLEVIQERGGEGNGVTSKRKTYYFATVPQAEGPWLVETFAKMMLNRSLRPEDLEKSRQEVQLEIGEPHPLHAFLGFDVSYYLTLSYLKSKDFYEYNFGLDLNSNPFSEEEVRLANQELNLRSVQKFYDNYYYPRNARLILSGAFDPTLVKESLLEGWKKEKDREGIMPPRPGVPHPRGRPHLIHSLASGSTPNIQMGSLLYDTTYVEEIAVNVFIKYIGNELMKEIRNRKGQTYTVLPNYFTEWGVGYASVELEAPREGYKEIRNTVRQAFRRVRNEGLSDEEFRKAKDLTMRQLGLVESDSESLHYLAASWREYKKRYGEDIASPYRVLTEMTRETMNQALVKHFAKERRLEYLDVPNVLFRYDEWVFGFALLLISLWICRWVLLKPFDHAGVRWIRKVRYPGLKVIEICALGTALFVFGHLRHVILTYLPELVEWRHNVIFNGYLLPWAEVLIGVGLFVGTLSFFPRKLMVEGDNLVVKSLTYYSFLIPFDKIQAVKAVPYWLVLMSPGLLWKLGWRHFVFHPFIWQKSLWVETEKHAYVFSIKNGNLASQELQSLIDKKAGHSGHDGQGEEEGRGGGEESQKSFPLQSHVM